MTDTEAFPLEAPPEIAPAIRSRARAALLKRLADVVCLPSSRVNTFERAVTADLLVELLREAETEERMRVARRLANLSEIPPSLVRLLLRDAFEVSNVLLEHCASLTEIDLLDCVRNASLDHRRVIAMRRGVGAIVAEALVDRMEPMVVETLLRNNLAQLSADAVEVLVATSRQAPELIPLMLKRPELRPSHAYILFWWADAAARRTILQRFAVSREVLQEAAGDVFPQAAAEKWSDPLARKALQFIERRQRNRGAIDKSPYADLEEAVDAAQSGMTRDLVEELSYLAGVKPMTGAKIFSDPGGESLAILCKATGLPRSALRTLWRGLGRPEAGPDGAMAPDLERVVITYDMIATDRAQTVLRYWNWSLSSALTPALVQAIRDGEEGAMDEYSLPQRSALLVFSRDFTR
ncbi:MAG TPA: DUF2336 domain-containing protein [Caulobacteraceae bacterium]|jgi:uncharacterized protein (DUF2336 family)|nr:DUF2336 domain-containing protein [Caulobacteraceae bacterium]